MYPSGTCAWKIALLSQQALEGHLGAVPPEAVGTQQHRLKAEDAGVLQDVVDEGPDLVLPD